MAWGIAERVPLVHVSEARHAERGDAAGAIAELVPLAVAKGREAVVDPDA